MTEVLEGHKRINEIIEKRLSEKWRAEKKIY